MTRLSSQQLDVAKAYYAQLQLHDTQRTTPQFCICLIGLIGSGKSTFLDALCAEVPVVRYSGDRVRELLHQRGMDINDGLLIAREVSLWLRDEGYNVAYDNDFGNPVIRADFQDVNRQAGITELWLRCKPPEDVILAHLHDDKHGYTFDSQERFAAQKQIHQSNLHEIESLPFLYTLDFSQPDSTQQTKEAIGVVKRAIEQLS